MSDTNTTQEYSGRVGERLRAIRRQKRISLQEVEAASGQEFKASVLGAYERGDTVPVDQLLPPDAGPSFGVESAEEVIDLTDSSPRRASSPITIDLTQLESLVGPEADMLNRYLTMVQVLRQDFNGRVLTVRNSDLQALAAILGTSVEGASPRLDSLGLSYQP